MKLEEIKIKIEECFKKCAQGRYQLRKCVMNGMKKGLSKADIVSIAHELREDIEHDEASLCTITAIGEAMQFEELYPEIPSKKLSVKEKEEIKSNLKSCFKKCGFARRQLRKCIVNAIDAGLTKDELLAITDDIVGGLGKNEVSACAIIAVDQVLRYEEFKRKKTLSMDNNIL